MNKINVIYLFLIISVIHPGELFSQLKAENLLFPVFSPVSINKKDSTKHRDNIKLDPLKIFFNEISVSYEHFNKSAGIVSPASDLTGLDSIIYKRKAEQISSMNYIFGFIFPSDINNAVQYKQNIHDACIERFGDAGMSPYINWGLSFKFEYRRYRNNFYYGPQLIEKFVFYPKTIVEYKSDTEIDSLIRLQSGYANILGLGYFIGWQIEKKGFVADFYLGVSGRMRLAVRKIYEEQNYMGPNVIFPEPKTENLNRFYPFLNLGIRLGFSL